MPLVDVDLVPPPLDLPGEIAAFLREADLRCQDFVSSLPATYRGFVPSDYVAVYHELKTIAENQLAAGNSFCEWGSGLGVAASLAAWVGFDAHGIEIDRELVDAAEQLAEDFDIAVEFIHGSFIPPGAESMIDQAFTECDGGLSLDPHSDDAYEQLGLDPRDFDLIFAFPWPNDEELTAQLFERYAARGALLLTYCESESLRLRRKTG